MKQVIEGELVVTESEGGFGPDSFRVDGLELSAAIAVAFGREVDCRGSLGEHVTLGRVRITIEPLEEDG